VNRRGTGSAWAILLAAAAAAAVVTGCASTPPEKDPVQIKLNDLDTRLARIERVVSNQSLLELSNQLETLQGDVRSLRNDVDQLGNRLDAGRKQQHDLYADLDLRVKNLESRGGVSSGVAAPPATALVPAGAPGSLVAAAPGAAAPGVAAPGASTAAPATSPPPVPDGTDRANYQAAFALLKDSQYDQAIAAFQQFLVSFPDSELAENAQYWLGEAYYVNRTFPDALLAFQRVVEKYPGSRKLPDALLKIGYCRYEMKQWAEARQTLSQVASTYPDTPAGRLAQQRLEKMGSESH
jgi:tol-pal system protein YbgF